MKPYIKKGFSLQELIDLDTGFCLMFAIKHSLTNTFRIIDFRLTDCYTDIDSFSSDFVTLQSLSFDVYSKYKDQFNFTTNKKISSLRKKVYIQWHSFNGVVVHGADRECCSNRFSTEEYLWSRKSMDDVFKDAFIFWDNYNGDINDSKINNCYLRPLQEDFF